MLVRDEVTRAEHGDGARVLAASPDSPERGDAWLWTVSLAPEEHDPTGWRVVTDADVEWLDVEQVDHHGPGEWSLDRAGGEQLVVVCRAGRHQLQDEDGPWRRWLGAGDVVVLEGEGGAAPTERLVLTAAGDGAATVVRLHPRDGRPLRWVP